MKSVISKVLVGVSISTVFAASSFAKCSHNQKGIFVPFRSGETITAGTKKVRITIGNPGEEAVTIEDSKEIIHVRGGKEPRLIEIVEKNTYYDRTQVHCE